MIKIWRTLFSTLILLVVLLLSTVAQAKAAGANIDTRIVNGFDWILGQETEYTPGSRAFVSSVSSKTDKYRIYVEENAIAASAFTMYHKVYTSTKYDEKLKSALTFIMAAQTPSKSFHHYWNMTTRKWDKDGGLFYWNAYVVEGLSFAAFHMRLSATLDSEKSFFNRARNAAVACIEEWHGGSQQPDGRWVFSYLDTVDHAEIDENGMVLTALLYLALYELYWGDREKMRTYTDWAEKTALWILSRQEMNTSSWAFGGFYHDETDNVQYTDSNGRALFGLTTYLRAIASLKNQTEPIFSKVRGSIHTWYDGFLVKVVDINWGPYWCRTKVGATEYPKLVYRAAELMRALVEVWIVLGDLKFEDDALKLYNWITGINEKGIDLQQAANRNSKNGGFYVGINVDGSLENDSNLETTATATRAFIYGRWITIPEFPNRSLGLFMPLVLLTILFANRCTRRFALRRKVA